MHFIDVDSQTLTSYWIVDLSSYVKTAHKALGEKKGHPLPSVSGNVCPGVVSSWHDNASIPCRHENIDEYFVDVP